MIIGYPFYAAAVAAAGTVATILDPSLRVAVTTITPRGKKPGCRVMGVTLNSDAPGLGSYGKVVVGNDGVDRYSFDIFPSLDADLATQPIKVAGWNDLGGFKVNENESIVITLYDPGAAENMSGVLYIDDLEPSLRIPRGRPVTLRTGGTNDAATAIAITGADLPTKKLEAKYRYYLHKATVRVEDKVCEAIIMVNADGVTATVTGNGTTAFNLATLHFTGEQWNAGAVKLFLQVQAATKVEIVWTFIEVDEGHGTGAEIPIDVQPMSMPGGISQPAALPLISDAGSAQLDYGNTGNAAPFAGFPGMG